MILGGLPFCQSVGHHLHEHKSLEKRVISGVIYQVLKKGDQGNLILTYVLFKDRNTPVGAGIVGES